MLNFQNLMPNDITKLTCFFNLRDNNTCDSVFLDVFLWKDYYKVQYAISDDNKALFFIMTIDDQLYASMPMCLESDLEKYFNLLLIHFNEVFNKKLKIYLGDEAAINHLKLSDENFLVYELEDSKDYLYSAKALKELSGKKLRKKKNHINAFLRENEGKFIYKQLSCSYRNEIWDFLMKWELNKGEEIEQHLLGEISGISDILTNCKELNVNIGGVFIENKLEAFTVASYNKKMKMIIVHIEKANPDIRGLYPFINQQFLLNNFPEAEIVNREDDLGIEGLRKAKLSYDPIGFAIKYRVIQK